MGSDVDTELIARLYMGGLSIRAVALQCGRSPKTVHRRLEAARVPRRPPSSHPPPCPSDRIEFTDEQTAEMITGFVDSHLSLLQLGERFRCSDDTIARHLRRHGVSVGRRRTPQSSPAGATPSERQVRRLHAQAHTPQQMSDELGCDLAAVRATHRDAGLEPHRGRPMPPVTTLTAAYAVEGSVRALSRRYPISERRLKAALAAAGVTIGPRRVSQADQEEFRRLDRDGVPVAVIARKTGWSRGTVAAHLPGPAAQGAVTAP